MIIKRSYENDDTIKKYYSVNEIAELDDVEKEYLRVFGTVEIPDYEYYYYIEDFIREG